MTSLQEQFLLEGMLVQLGAEETSVFAGYINAAFLDVQIAPPIQRELALVELVARHSGVAKELLKTAVELIDQPDAFLEHLNECVAVIEEGLAERMEDIVDGLDHLALESLSKPCIRVVSEVDGETMRPSLAFRARVSEHPADQIASYRQYEDQLHLLSHARVQLGLGDQEVSYSLLPELFDGGFEHSLNINRLVEEHPDKVSTAKGAKAWSPACAYSFA